MITVVSGEVTRGAGRAGHHRHGAADLRYPVSRPSATTFGTDYLHFFDAAAPLVTAESVDMDLSLVAVPV